MNKPYSLRRIRRLLKQRRQHAKELKLMRNVYRMMRAEIEKRLHMQVLKEHAPKARKPIHLVE